MRLLCSLSVRACAPPPYSACVSISAAQPAERADLRRGPSRVRQVGTPCTDHGHPGSETRGSDRAGMPSLGVRGAVVGELGPEVLRQLVLAAMQPGSPLGWYALLETNNSKDARNIL